MAGACCSGITTHACTFEDAVHTLDEIQTIGFKLFPYKGRDDCSDGFLERGAGNSACKLLHSNTPCTSHKHLDEVRGDLNRPQSAAGWMRWRNHIHDNRRSEPTFTAATARRGTADVDDLSADPVAGACATSNSTAPIELLVKNMSYRANIEHPGNLDCSHPERADAMSGLAQQAPRK